MGGGGCAWRQPPETRGLRRAMPRLRVATPSPSRAASPFLPLAAATATATASGWVGGAAPWADPGTWRPRPGRLFFRRDEIMARRGTTLPTRGWDARRPGGGGPPLAVPERTRSHRPLPRPASERVPPPPRGAGAPSPDPNCWVTLNFLNSVPWAAGDVTASVSNFSAPSLLAPLPTLLATLFCRVSPPPFFFFFFFARSKKRGGDVIQSCCLYHEMLGFCNREY